MAGTQKLRKFDPTFDDVGGPPGRRAESGETGAAATSERGMRTVETVERPLEQPIIEEESLVPPTADEDDEPVSRSGRAVDREQGIERLRTRHARKFTTLADDVTEGFIEFQIGAGAWGAELTAPEGMSTRGGKQVLQHLRLRPKRPGHAVLVGGVVNPILKTAELRDFEHMAMICRARFGTALEITPAEWEQFLRKAEVVLRDHDIDTARVHAPKDLRAAVLRAEAVANMRKLAIIALAIVVPLALVVVWRVIVALSE